MADYVKGTQNHLDIVPIGAAAAGDCVPIAELANLVGVYTRPYAAGAQGAAAYTGVFRFATALTDQDVGTPVDILTTGKGSAVASSTSVGGVLTRAIVGDPGVCEVAINVTSMTP